MDRAAIEEILDDTGFVVGGAGISDDGGIEEWEYVLEGNPSVAVSIAPDSQRVTIRELNNERVEVPVTNEDELRQFRLRIVAATKI